MELEANPPETRGKIVWRPTPDCAEQARLTQFMRRHGIDSLSELMEKSTLEIEWFWTAVLEDLDIEFYEPYRTILDTSRGIAWPEWCVGGKMNIVHNCLDKRMGTEAENRLAIFWEGEEGSVRTLTYGDLYSQVNRIANALRTLGLRKGDRVGLFLPMLPETAVALLAVAKIGGAAIPIFSGYGPAAVAERLADAEAKALVIADGFYRRGESVLMKTVADEALSKAPSVESVLVVRRLGREIPWSRGRDHWWHEALEAEKPFAETEKTSAEDTLMLIYTSGTTGRPKGAVHTHCGFPVKAAQDMAHGLDVQAKDTLYWVTDIGWMMGPWEIFGGTLLGATIVLYDGALDYPGPDRLWATVERHGVTILGVSPTLVRSLMRHGDGPVRRHDLKTLRVLGSTGEPWNPQSWNWLFKNTGNERLPIVNYSGGTEVSGGIVMGNLLTPIKPCSFAGPVPGMAADVVDDDGRPVRNQVGELVVRKPWIGMTRGFWKDPDRYLETYWSRFPGLWVHGDWAEIDADGLWYILGRSDDTIKVAGKRLGPAEIESVLAAHPAVAEAAVIGVPDPVKGESAACFCVLKSPEAAGEDLSRELGEWVVRHLGKPLRPRVVAFVADLPKTRNAKVMRRVIRSAYLNLPAGDLSALENPESVEEIKKLVAVGSQPSASQSRSKAKS